MAWVAPDDEDPDEEDPDEEDPDDDEPEDTEPPDNGARDPDEPSSDEPSSDEADRCDREGDPPERVLLALVLPLALPCDDPGSTAAIAPDAAALAIPMPAVTAVSHRRPRLRSADGE